MIINADDFENVDEAIKAKILDPVVISIDQVNEEDRTPFFSRNPYVVFTMNIEAVSKTMTRSDGLHDVIDVTIESRNREKLAKYTVGVK
jgi:hypothetical protein